MKNVECRRGLLSTDFLAVFVFSYKSIKNNVIINITKHKKCTVMKIVHFKTLFYYIINNVSFPPVLRIRIRSFWVTQIRIRGKARSGSGSSIHKKTVILIFSLYKIV